jgi:dTMP kinase
MKMGGKNLKKNTTKGFFVAIDGPNGVGKTTLLEEIEKIIKSKNVQLHKTKEPTNSILGKFIREISEEINGDTLACLVSADRYEHLKNEIIPELKKGKIVITDRYILSSLILQVMDGVKESFILNLNSKIIKPDLQLAIFAEEEIIQNRLKQRDKLTRFEKNNQSKKEINNMKKGIDKLRKLNVEVLCINNNDDLEYNANKIADYIIENWRKK